MAARSGAESPRVRQRWRGALTAGFVPGCGDLGAPVPRPQPGTKPAPTLRWALTHMIEETARHAGHADILRELIDGTTGR
ncbi:DUF664 domain-containing protein [Catenulispora sp. GAS73]|uniref:mycothiol transferase n=1 Tax=Catenulispora sp. GAS73 TaxID=3156269 RepID=UPI003514178A